MPRLRQVPRAEVTAPIVEAMYGYLFDDRDPVAEPGTSDGTSGDWWTVMANSPAAMQHAVDGFLFYQSPDRALDPILREVAQLRVGVASGSEFVIAKHRLALGRLGADPGLIEAVGTPGALPEDPAAAEVVAVVDQLVGRLGEVDDQTFDALRARLGDEAMLELCYVATMYLMHAVLSKALRTEQDG